MHHSDDTSFSRSEIVHMVRPDFGWLGGALLAILALQCCLMLYLISKDRSPAPVSVSTDALRSAQLDGRELAMNQLLKNDRLVEELSTVGAPVRVLVRLCPGSDGRKFEWIAGSGPPDEDGVEHGNLISALIIVEQKAPVDLVVPTLKKKLSLH